MTIPSIKKCICLTPNHIIKPLELKLEALAGGARDRKTFLLLPRLFSEKRKAGKREKADVSFRGTYARCRVCTIVCCFAWSLTKVVTADGHGWDSAARHPRLPHHTLGPQWSSRRCKDRAGGLRASPTSTCLVAQPSCLWDSSWTMETAHPGRRALPSLWIHFCVWGCCVMALSLWNDRMSALRLRKATSWAWQEVWFFQVHYVFWNDGLCRGQCPW